MSSPPTTARTASDNHETVLKKRAESADVGWRPGSRSRPIPEMQIADDPFPRDPDKDSPDVFVSSLSQPKYLKKSMVTVVLSSR